LYSSAEAVMQQRAKERERERVTSNHYSKGFFIGMMLAPARERG